MYAPTSTLRCEVICVTGCTAGCAATEGIGSVYSAVEAETLGLTT